ncbi:MAG: SDR family NAD(P)-dependent oxidoreductase [Candidatus Dormiibacterota bacterium]
MKEIGGKVAVVTGASKGLGAYIAETLFDHGLKVVVAARSASELEALTKRLDKQGQRTLAVTADVTKEADRTRLLDAARERFGQVDIIVNNAGTDHPQAFIDVDLDEARRMFDLNVMGTLALTQAVLPEMMARGSGHIVNIASVAGLAPTPFGSVYAATKHAVVGFTESLRWEMEGTGVSASVVCPYFVREAGLYHDNTAGGESKVPTSSPQEVADAVVKAITGDKARVVVSPFIVKLGPLGRAISPEIIFRAGRTNGSFDAMKGMADRLREEEARATRAKASGKGADADKPVKKTRPKSPAKA